MLIIQINKVCKELWQNFSVKQLSVVLVLCVSVTPSSDTLSRLHNFLSNRRIYFVPRGGISAFSAKSVSVRLYCSEVSLLSGVYNWSNCKWWGTILFNNFKEYFFSFSCSEPLLIILLFDGAGPSGCVAKAAPACCGDSSREGWQEQHWGDENPAWSS